MQVEYDEVQKQMGKKVGTVCSQEDCALRNERLWNKCNALEQCYESAFGCPYYKTYDELMTAKVKQKFKCNSDERYRKLVQKYAKGATKDNKL